MSSLSSWGRTALHPVLEARAREEAMQHSASPAASLTGQRFGHLPWGDAARGTGPKGAALLTLL